MSLVRWSERSRRAKVSPGTPGSTQSSSTRSGRVSRTSASACGTSPAHMTLYPARCRLAASRSRIAASSSTTRIEPPMASPVVGERGRCYVGGRRRTIAGALFNSRVILAACRFAPTRRRPFLKDKSGSDPDFRLLPEPGEMGGDARTDDVGVDRLEDEFGEGVATVRAAIALRGEEDDGYAPGPLEAADGGGSLEAVDTGQADVEQDGGELAPEHLAQRILARIGAMDARAQVLEHCGQGEEILRLVVYQQYVHHACCFISVATIGCSAMRRSRLETKASAPASSAAMRSATESLIDMTTTRHAGHSRRNARAVSMPFFPGSSRFTRIRSSAACPASMSASSMLRASRSFRGGKEVRSQSRSALRISSCSSTTSTDGKAGFTTSAG